MIKAEIYSGTGIAPERSMTRDDRMEVVSGIAPERSMTIDDRMEAAGIEPASEKSLKAVSTCLFL
jgi:hypothetical protein